LLKRLLARLGDEDAWVARSVSALAEQELARVRVRPLSVVA
jgi:hypothetical protein